MTLLAAHELSYTYHLKNEQIPALTDVSLTLKECELVCLFGSSGSGKSTLLTLLAGLDSPDRGAVVLGGRDISGLSAEERGALRLHQVGMIFQDNNLVAQFTAAENVELILRCQGATRAKDEARSLLESINIGHLADRYPADMSGGQRQRVGIARAMAGKRAVILCDEPTGALDQQNSMELFSLLRRRAHEDGLAVLIATHDRLAESFADRVFEIVDGRLQERR